MFEQSIPYPRIDDTTPIVTKTLIDTEAFASFFKETCQRNEPIVSQFTKIPVRNPIADRIPTSVETSQPGMDAAVAGTLGFIPLNHLKYIMMLHNGNYSESLIEEMRTHVSQIQNAENFTETLDDLYTFWWLAMSSVSIEGETNSVDFYNQYHDVVLIASNKQDRFQAAKNMLANISDSFTLDKKTNLPYGSTDGCLHASYLAGHDIATMYASAYDLYFLGTFVPGKFNNIIQHHNFSAETDSQGRSKSGVINDTFLKFATYEEMVIASNLL